MKPVIASQQRTQPDLDELHARTKAMPGSLDNQFTDNVWCFKNTKGRIVSIDFNSASGISETFPDWVLETGIEPILFCKQVWLYLAESTTVGGYQGKLKGLILFLVWLAKQERTKLTRDNARDFLAFILTTDWNGGQEMRLRTVRGRASFQQFVSIENLKNALSQTGLDWISHDVTLHFFNRQLKDVVPELTGEGLTYVDWKAGGSLNLLTLDYGRYYVEHCLNFFEKHAPLAVALSQTFNEVDIISESLGLSSSSVDPLLPRILEGRPITDFLINKNHVLRIRKVVEQHFLNAYRQSILEHDLLQDTTLKAFVKACGLNPTLENLDRLRVIIWDWFRQNDRDEVERLLGECQVPITWVLFKKHLDAVKQRCDSAPISIPTVEFFRAQGLKAKAGGEDEVQSNNGLSLPRQFIKLVANAGLTGVVALTGWRSSEFGFPSSHIRRIRNTDKLDQYAFPHRYQVDWYVHKTNGQVRALRDVTFSTIAIAERLRQIHNIGDTEPCLYGVQESNEHPFESENKVSKAVTSLWQHYATNYPGFELVENWESWKRLSHVLTCDGLLTMEQHRERERLLALNSKEEWDKLQIDSNLKEAYRRVREELPRILFFFKSGSSDRDEWVRQYLAGTLRPEWAHLLDAHLSDETQDWLASLSETQCGLKHTSTALRNELLQDTLYPSPHAFRHMWAEAVYRRFDGDAGWMIRSQFKHISRSMWLAYIRDKDNRGGHQQVKIQVVSSLLQNYIKNNGEGYAGQMHKMLRRLLRKTQIQSPEQQLELAEKLATMEIENIRADPWGFCLLMRRSKHRARCAEQGEPMRHNASPELCLGCVHHLMQSTNVEWMLFQIASQVELLRNPIVPNIFKQASFDLVKKVTRHIYTLDSEHEALSELETVLNEYKARAA